MTTNALRAAAIKILIISGDGNNILHVCNQGRGGVQILCEYSLAKKYEFAPLSHAQKPECGINQPSSRIAIHKFSFTLISLSLPSW